MDQEIPHNPPPSKIQQPPETQPPTSQSISAGQPASVTTTKLLSGFPLKAILIIVILIGLSTGGGILAYTLLKNDQAQKTQERAPLPTSQPTLAPSISKMTVDNFDSTFLDEDKWHSWALSDKSRVEQKGGKIEIGIPAGFTEYASAGLDSTTVINGNFEATVEAAIVNGGENFGSETALVFHDDVEGWPNQLSIFLRKEADGKTYIHAAKVLNSEYEELTFDKSYLHSGPFTIRISREKGAVTFSVKEGGIFVPIGQPTSEFYTGSGRITLHVNSFGPNFPSVLSIFDNFSLKH